MSDQSTNGREWWPLEWADEVMPPSRPSPDGFIICADGHWYLGYAFDATYVNDHEKRYFSQAINAGDIVKFICCDELGSIDVTINPDGTFAADGSVPERATHFWEPGNFDTLGDTLAEFVRGYLDTCDPLDAPATVTVAMAWWSDGIPHKLTWTFEGGPHGKAVFVQVSEAEATQ
jgi:hypothetical protein